MFVSFGWKEYRSLRSMWCWVAGLTVVGVGVAGLFATASSPSPSSYQAGIGDPGFVPGQVGASCYQVAWLGVAALGLAATATLLAGERQAGTWEMLVRLPISTGQIWLVKLAAAALAQVLLLVPVSVVAGMVSSGGGVRTELIFGLGLSMPEALAWGMLFSALMRRTLTVATAAGTAMAILYLLLTLVTPGLHSIEPESTLSLDEFLSSWWVLRSALAIVALGSSLAILDWPRLRCRLGYASRQ